MKKAILTKIDQLNVKKEPLKPFAIGNTIKVYTKIKEGDKERIQVFSGIVIARKGSGATETFTVRRVTFGEGVERIFPLHSPSIDKIEIEEGGTARRAKLYYLRNLSEKTAKFVVKQR